MCTNFTYTYRGLNVLNVKALIGTFNQKKVQLGAFFMIVISS